MRRHRPASVMTVGSGPIDPDTPSCNFMIVRADDRK